MDEPIETFIKTAIVPSTHPVHTESYGHEHTVGSPSALPVVLHHRRQHVTIPSVPKDTRHCGKHRRDDVISTSGGEVLRSRDGEEDARVTAV